MAAPVPDLRDLRACGCCGLVQQVGDVPAGFVARCCRCHDVVLHGGRGGTKTLARTAALALAALILYPLAMSLPVMEIEQLGRSHSTTILSGAAALIGEGQVAIGVIVLVCSVVIPLFKLLGLFALTAGNLLLSRRRRALTYRLVEWTGRWGMVDVLLVALLVAIVKLGDFVDVHPGPGAVAFAAVVVLSLLASASFDRTVIWEEGTMHNAQG
jgi:paraquat-inducible protein A